MTPQYYQKETLETIARHVISKYDGSLLRTPASIPVETIMELVYGLKIDFQFIRNNGRILGETVFEDMVVPIYERENEEGYKLIPVTAGTVIIDASLINNRGDGRFRYTCAHELAHWVIHKGFYTQSGETAAMTKAVKSSESDKAIEWQADRLGSYFLMPKGVVKMAFYRNRNDRNIVDTLALLFGVSRQAMEIRLVEMRLLP
ncbi:MAG: ImmA/IrrE family metallo-endopeptidase [Eubacteriales bacterium]|nr:ImmA/IrrE family metallo-endopeptidase [Eubacteriales bacterium]